jgi:hypothetical protein
LEEEPITFSPDSDDDSFPDGPDNRGDQYTPYPPSSNNTPSSKGYTRGASFSSFYEDEEDTPLYETSMAQADARERYKGVVQAMLREYSDMPNPHIHDDARIRIHTGLNNGNGGVEKREKTRSHRGETRMINRQMSKPMGESSTDLKKLGTAYETINSSYDEEDSMRKSVASTVNTSGSLRPAELTPHAAMVRETMSRKQVYTVYMYIFVYVCT